MTRSACAIYFALLLSGCGGGGQTDWYYHWNCHGDAACLSTNPTGQPSGDIDEGPQQEACTSLLTFAAHFWKSPATNSCDQSATPGGVGSTPTITSLVVTPASSTPTVGQTVQLTATGHYSDGSTKDLTSASAWSVAGTVIIGPPPVVTVGATGLVTAVSPGTKQIQATYGALSGSATITVVAAVLTGITVTPSSPSLEVGATQQFTATANYSDGSSKDVTATATWSSSATSVAAFGYNHLATPALATALAGGTTTITAGSGGLFGSTTLTVYAATLVSIAVLPADPTVAAGLKIQFSATGTYSNGTSANLTGQAMWASGTGAVASIAAGGLASSLSPGTSAITAAVGAISGGTTLTVGPVALVSISVYPLSPTVTAGRTQQLTAYGHYSDGTTQDLTSVSTWTSATTAAATVNTTGLVTGVAPGTSVVTAASGGKSGSITVNVVALGAVWQPGQSGTTSALNGVAWCAGMFVAVGASGTIVTSPDGITWIARTSGTSSDLNAVGCSPSLILAAGNAGAVVTSPDGANWTVRTPAGATTAIRAETWDGTRFLVGGDWGYMVGTAAGPGSIGASVDGVSWTIRTAATTATIRGISWSGGRYVVAGDNQVQTSTDGTTWTGASTQALYGVAWTGATFALVGGTSNLVYLTTDGANFTFADTKLTNRLNAVVWSGAQLTAVGIGGSVTTSPDGSTWTPRSSGVTADLLGVAWSGAGLVAVGTAGTTLLSQ